MIAHLLADTSPPNPRILTGPEHRRKTAALPIAMNDDEHLLTRVAIANGIHQIIDIADPLIVELGDDIPVLEPGLVGGAAEDHSGYHRPASVAAAARSSWP